MALAGQLSSNAVNAETLIADEGYDSDAFREALAARGIAPCIPPRAKRRLPATCCKTLYDGATRWLGQ
jgi:IS5 family transposase